MKPGNIDNKAMKHLASMPASLAIAALNKLSNSDLSYVHNVAAYLQGIIRHASSHPSMATTVVNQPPPLCFLTPEALDKYWQTVA